MNETLHRFLTAVERETGHAPAQNGDGWKLCCPAHDDKTPSLSVTTGDDGRVLLKCFAGCTTQEVITAVGLQLTDLFVPSQRASSARNQDRKPGIVVAYDYPDENGTLLFQVVRLHPKGFRQRRPKPGGGWIWNLQGVRRVLFACCFLQLAEPDRPVFVVEGEKDALRIMDAGGVATTCPGGAGKWRPDYTDFFGQLDESRDVVILPDNDPAGRQHAEEVARSLSDVARSVKVVELPGLPAKGDVSDYFDAGNSIEDLENLACHVAPWQPDVSDQPTASNGWNELQPLGACALPKFPSHVLPEQIREFVVGLATATQTPEDLAGLLCLAVCSSAVARKVDVVPRPGWREPVNLFAAVLLEPGNRKSAVFADVIRPLKDYERELVESSRLDIAIQASERRQAVIRLKTLEKKAANSTVDVFDDSGVGSEARELAQRLATWSEPVAPALSVDDVTSEKLGVMLEQQGGRLASLSPEGSVFDVMAGMYSKSGMPQFGVYLMGHAGDDLRTDRIGRDPVYVERPALTAAYAMQPAVIEGLAGNAAFRGRGLLARFLYAAPESFVGQRDVSPPPVPDQARTTYSATVRALLEMRIPEATDEIAPISLSPDAEEILLAWMQETEDWLDVGGSLEMLRDWGAKLAGLTARVAGVFHCIQHARTRNWQQPISAETLQSAIEIARYACPHAEHVLQRMNATEGDNEEKAGEIVWRWISRSCEKREATEFSKRDLHRGLQRRFKKADDLDDPIALLISRGYVREKQIATAGGKGRPVSPVYEVNPAALNNRKESRKRHNPVTEMTKVE